MFPSDMDEDAPPISSLGDNNDNGMSLQPETLCVPRCISVPSASADITTVQLPRPFHFPRSSPSRLQLRLQPNSTPHRGLLSPHLRFPFLSPRSRPRLLLPIR